MPEKTLCLIKSHVMADGRCSIAINAIRASGFNVVASMGAGVPANQTHKELRSLFTRLYQEHEGRDYYASLILSVTEPVASMALVLEGDDVVARFRAALGATDPRKAVPGSLRHQFGVDLPHNAFHGSDSVASAEREIAIFFARPPG